MRGKDRAAVSEEREADVAATKPKKNGAPSSEGYLRILAFLLAFGSLMLGFQNCTVENSYSTPGASTFFCDPSPEALNEFEIPLENILLITGNISGTSVTGCADCHGTVSGDSSARAVFTVYEGDLTSDPSLLKRNLCSAAIHGDDVVKHVLQPTGHGGGQYLESEIQSLADFVRIHF